MQQQLMKKEVMILKENKKGSTEGFKGVKGKRERLYYNLKKKCSPTKKLRMTHVPEPDPCFPEQGSRMGTSSALFSPAQSLCFFLFFLFQDGDGAQSCRHATHELLWRANL